MKDVHEILSECERKRAETILLQNYNLEAIPEKIYTFSWLKVLNLRGNRIRQVSDKIGNLKNLIWLFLGDNKIEYLPRELAKLKFLTLIDLSNNNFKLLPLFIFEFKLIYNINVNHYEWQTNTLFLNGNPIENPPIEILNQGIKNINNYYSELDQDVDFLYEAKLLIVGEAGAGKTSLAKKILEPTYKLDSDQNSTEGIDILPYNFLSKDNKEFKVNIWDFGGQEIYHSTHQFFLTKRSLYILLSDSRAENTDFNYWLQVIELLSQDSPLIIVQNEKQDRVQQINISGMRGRFPNLIKVLRTNLLSNRGLNFLLKEIRHQIEILPHIGSQLPKTWIDIRSELEKISAKKNFITLEKYFKICTKNNLSTKERALFLSDYLHDLGVFLHFQDNPILKKIVFLNTAWATDAVYQILDNKRIKSQNGHFSKKDISEIWNHESYKEMEDELLELMMKFELCYQVPNSDVYIAPQLLSVEQPNYTPKHKKFLTIRYDYEFLPKGILTRFIVRMHKYIVYNKLVWKEGVVLSRDSSQAEIIETYGKQQIQIRVAGKTSKEFLTIILETFDEIHSTFSELKVTKLVPCNCSDCSTKENQHYFKYSVIKNFINNNIGFISCEKSTKRVQISTLISEVFENPDTINIFLSYSIKDDLQKNNLFNHLNLINQNQKIEFYDQNQLPLGVEIKHENRIRLKKSNILILLVSSDYLNSDNFKEINLDNLIDRSNSGNFLIIPIIIRPCLIDDLPISRLQILPRNKKPISSFSNLDEIYSQITIDINNIIRTFIKT